MLEKKVEAFLRRKQFQIENQSILIGVSGGPDSLALLHFLWSRQEMWNLKIIVAHVDHMLRGFESEQEALFVKDFCDKRNIPIEMKQIDVPQFMRRTGLSSEVAARECRYSFFKEVLLKNNLPLLALGHHGDDQIETVLMRLTRGSTGTARAGIPFLRPFQNAMIFRPFLCVSRDEIEDYCKRYELEPRRDPSNEDVVFTRNRFRKTVLPFLKKENPQVHEHFQRFSEDLERDEIFLQELASCKLKEAIKEHTDKQIRVGIRTFQQMPIPLQRRGIQLILNYLYKEKPASLSAVHIDQVISIMESPFPSGKLDFPSGLEMIRSYDECIFRFHEEVDVQSYYFTIKEPGELLLPNGNRIIVEWVTEEMDKGNNSSILLHMDSNHLPLIVRTRKSGDRMTVKGMKGSKKIKDIFIDEKIPLHKRDNWPIVTDCFDQIIWIPGIKKGSKFLKKQSAQQITILLTYEQEGTS